MSNRFFPNYPGYIITSPFGTRIHPVSGVKSMHNGIDLVATKDGKTGLVDHIKAHTGGTVEECGYNSSAGNFVRIQVSENTVMSYCHFRDKLNWQKGQKIEKGTVLGYMGRTGTATGDHLHFGIQQDGKWIDPKPYLDKDYTESAEAAESTEATKPAEAQRKTASVALPVIRYGYRGEDVKAMQNLLILRGHSCGDAGADGIYGDDTKTALLAFQGKQNLEQDAVCGKDTWTALITA